MITSLTNLYLQTLMPILNARDTIQQKIDTLQ
jgi:hypothetical protein